MVCALIKEGYDVERLRQEVDSLDGKYLKHPGQVDYWSGMLLRNPTGETTGVRVNDLISDDGTFRDTEYMQRTPYIKSILDELPAEILSVRVLKVKTGGSLTPHQDGQQYSFKRGTICRLHLPIYTSPDVAFVIDGIEYHLEAGKLYYTNVARMHTVHNRGDSDRVHLVIDVRSSPVMLEMIANGRRP